MRVRANGLIYQRSRLKDFPFQLEIMNKTYMDILSTNNVSTVNFAILNVLKSVSTTQQHLFKLFKKIVCIVGTAMKYVLPVQSKRGSIMEQNKRLDYLIQYLINEDKQYYEIAIPKSTDEKKRILRSLMNIREPLPISREFLKIQDEYLQEELKRQQIISIQDLTPLKPQLYLWKGDITKLQWNNKAGRILQLVEIHH